MAPVNDSFAQATLVPVRYDQTVEVVQTEFNQATIAPDEQLVAWAIDGVDYIYEPNTDSFGLVGSVWFRLTGVSPGDEVTVRATGFDGGLSYMTLSVWSGTGLGDLVVLTARQVITSPYPTLTVSVPDRPASVWVRVAQRNITPVAERPTRFTLEVTGYARRPGEWLNSPPVTIEMPGVYVDGWATYLPGTSTFPALWYEQGTRAQGHDVYRGFNAGGFLSEGNEGNPNWPHNDPNAWSCIFQWGRRDLNLDFLWWTDDNTVDGGFPGSCPSLATWLGYVDWPGDDNSHERYQATGWQYYATDDGAPGLAAGLHATTYNGFSTLEIDHVAVRSYRPVPAGPWPEGAIGYAYEPGITTITEMTHQPVLMGELADTAGDGVTVEFWAVRSEPNVKSFGWYEEGGWPDESTRRHFVSDTPSLVKATHKLVGTLVQGVSSAPVVLDPAYYANRTDTTVDIIVKSFDKDMLEDTYPGSVVGFGTVYKHYSSNHTNRYTMTVQPPRFRWLYPDGIAPLRLIQRDDQLGPHGHARMSGTGAANPASSMQSSRGRIIKNTSHGYR